MSLLYWAYILSLKVLTLRLPADQVDQYGVDGKLLKKLLEDHIKALGGGAESAKK